MARVYNFRQVLQCCLSLCLKSCGRNARLRRQWSERYGNVTPLKIYGTIIEGAEALLREVMNIPDNYKVLFLQGGASTQFAAIPMNLMTKSGKADYVITGQWAKRLMQRLPVTVRLMLLLHRLTRPSHTFQSLILQHSQRTLTISTFA